MQPLRYLLICGIANKHLQHARQARSRISAVAAGACSLEIYSTVFSSQGENLCLLKFMMKSTNRQFPKPQPFDHSSSVFLQERAKPNLGVFSPEFSPVFACVLHVWSADIFLVRCRRTAGKQVRTETREPAHSCFLFVLRQF
jgi:hypothetical protein